MVATRMTAASAAIGLLLAACGQPMQQQAGPDMPASHAGPGGVEPQPDGGEQDPGEGPQGPPAPEQDNSSAGAVPLPEGVSAAQFFSLRCIFVADTIIPLLEGRADPAAAPYLERARYIRRKHKQVFASLPPLDATKRNTAMEWIRGEFDNRVRMADEYRREYEIDQIVDQCTAYPAPEAETANRERTPS